MAHHDIQNHQHNRELHHHKLLEGLTNAIAEYNIIEGGSFQIEHQVTRLRELVGKCAPKSIMEIGFNAGHSALLFLAITSPETKVVSFDLGEYAYVFAAKRYIDEVFPGRHTLVTGDSTVTIPKYEEQVAHRMKNPESAPPLRFDFIFIDGGHEKDIPLKDIFNSQRLASGPNTVVAIDDICRNQERHAHYTIEPTNAWLQMIYSGIIKEDGYDDYYDMMMRDNTLLEPNCRVRGMAWGTYSIMPSEETLRISSLPKLSTEVSLQKIRHRYYQNSSKYMDRNQMLQEIHNQHHYYKDHEKLVAISDMYLEYFPTYNKRDTNYVRFYRASSNFILNPVIAIQQFQEIIDTPSPPPNAPNGVNDNESELPDFIKEASLANLGMLYPSDPCPEIPKIIHLLYFGETDFYNFHHRCVHSMLQYMPDYEIRIYNSKEPVGNTYWDDIKNQARVRIHKLDPPAMFDGFELKHFQYKADVSRLELLYEHGGVYLDIDMIIIRPFHEVFNSGHSFYISEEREGSNGRGSGALINAFLAAKPKNEFIKLWLNEFKSGLRLGIWAHHIRDSNKQLIDSHPHYMHKYRIRILDWKMFMPLHWQDTEAFLRSETVPYEFPSESYGTHLWETILGDIMRKNEFLHKQKMELIAYQPRERLQSSTSYKNENDKCDEECDEYDENDLTIYPEYYHSVRNDQYVDKYITKGKNGGYFIEIGAGDGETGSACYFFEKYREWRGLAVEPARIYEPVLRKNRKNPIASAVSNVTSSITNGSGSGAIFYETPRPEISGLKYSLENNKEDQEWSQSSFKSYRVDTTTLYDLCCQNSVPEFIDYCAIDSEGSEFEILSTFFEENQLSAIRSQEPAEDECIHMIVLNKVFSIGFFSVVVSSNKIYERICHIMTRNLYEEVTNPYMSVIKNTDEHVNTKYFMLRNGSSASSSGTHNSPLKSESSISSISSGVNFTPQTLQTPPSSPDISSVTETIIENTVNTNIKLSSASASASESASSSGAFLHTHPFAEEVVVICLKERPERTEYVSQHLNSKGINHTVLLNSIHPQDTKVGCFRSHINAIRYADNKNLSSVLIMEDDVIVRDNIHELRSNAFPSDNWDILYLGGILTKYDGIDDTRKWVKGTIWCNHAYLVKQHMYKPILELVDTYPNLIDLERKNIDYMYTEYIQPKYQCWLANDQYIIQKEGFSEIDGRVKWGAGFDWSTFSMKIV